MAIGLDMVATTVVATNDDMLVIANRNELSFIVSSPIEHFTFLILYVVGNPVI
ncbi:hypothetical protein Hanom_Chr10g00877881 [Helianthus anomalus]